MASQVIFSFLSGILLSMSPASGLEDCKGMQAASSRCQCARAQEKLEVFFRSQKNFCRQDDDCDGFFFRANSRLPAVILPKKIVTSDFEAKVLPLQDEIRRACAAEWTTQPPGEPTPYKAACRKQTCVDLAN